MPRKSTTKTKQALIDLFGGACQACGYNRSHRALHFHHKDASEKDEWSDTGRASVAEVQAHPERFALLCANCHAEAHDALDVARQIYDTCPICGESFTVNDKRRADGRDVFCSKPCFARGRYLIAKPLEERFWKHVQKTDGCWEWTGYKDSQGRGRVSLYSGHDMLATRAAWEMEHGPIPTDRVLLPCQNPSCIRPDHMQLGTRSDANKRAYSTGRRSRGEKHGQSKLVEQQVREIRQRYAKDRVSQLTLAQEYGVSQNTIRDVVVRKTWSHVE